jgi:hypothetical protein
MYRSLGVWVKARRPGVQQLWAQIEGRAPRLIRWPDREWFTCMSHYPCVGGWDETRSRNGGHPRAGDT